MRIDGIISAGEEMLEALGREHYLTLAGYSARYLRAWQMAAVQGTLLERFAEDWYRNPAAGRFLHGLMERGQEIAADRLVKDVTGCRLSFEPVRVRLEQMLN